MYSKIIEEEKIYFSPIEINDTKYFTKWFNDIDIARMYSKDGLRKFYTEQTTREKLEEYIKNNEMRFEVIRKQDNKPLGLYSLNKIDWMNQTCRVSGFIGDLENRSKGYGTEALKLICDIAFTFLHMRTIVARIHSYNLPSIKSVLKIGFKKVGTIKNFIKLKNKYYDYYYFQLMPTTFYKNNMSYCKLPELNFSKRNTKNGFIK